MRSQKKITIAVYMRRSRAGYKRPLEGDIVYRYKRSIPLSYERQGQLYFWMLQYRDLPPHEQQIIRDVCASVGGDEYAPALLEFVTTDHGCTAISMRHHTSPATLWRYVRPLYLRMSAAGRLRIRSWEDGEGNRRKAAEVAADSVYFCDSRREDKAAAPDREEPLPWDEEE